MGVRLIEKRGAPHHCALPKKGWPWNRNPICTIGNVVQCDECGQKWRWGYSYANDEFPGWCPVNDKPPRPPVGRKVK